MIKPWKKIKEKMQYNGYRKVARWTFQTPSGKLTEYDILLGGVTVCVLALTRNNEVILAKQFRHGPQKVLLELPGGTGNGDEKPLEAIQRELLEETGYTGDFQFVTTDYRGATSDRISYNFVATNCYKMQEPMLDEEEIIEPVLMSLTQFRDHLRNGQLTDVSTAYLGLDYLKLLQD